MRHLLVVTAALGLTLVITAVSAARSPSASPGASLSPFQKAVSFLPPGAMTLAFTDWARIRASVGAEDVTGASPIGDKTDLILATATREAAPSAFGLTDPRHHHATWGFDGFDLAWEATVSLQSGPYVYVLRFRHGFDLGDVAARFDEHGFSTTRVPGAVIRSHDPDPYTTAFLADGTTLLVSYRLGDLRDVLAAGRSRPRPADRKPLVAGFEDTITALDGASGAWLMMIPEGCRVFTPEFDMPHPPPTSAPSASREPLHPYSTLGVAYGRPEWDPIGRIVMGYPDPTWAVEDLDVRAEEARTGRSDRYGVPYSEVFRLGDASVSGDALVLEVEPDDLPNRLFWMTTTRDMSFARC